MTALPMPDPAVPRTLRAIQPHRLTAFLDPYRDFFRERGVELPQPGSEMPVPYDRLVEVIISADMPDLLARGLRCVAGLAMPALMPAVLTALQSDARAGGEDDLTPADFAAQLWLLSPQRSECLLAQLSLGEPCPFECFRARGIRPPAIALSGEALAAMERDFAAWFEAQCLGREARLFVAHRPSGVWLLVRHGAPYKREECSCGPDPSGVAYRPLAYDTIVYDPKFGELRVCADTDGAKDMYRRVLGCHLFDRADAFGPAAKYTLKPLRDSREACLVCADVPGLELVTLREVYSRWGGAFAEYEVTRSDDVFAALRDRNRSIPASPELVWATFEIKHRGLERTRCVTIMPPNTALYDRDQDVGPVEEWLSRRGFLEVKDDDRTAQPLLASA